MSDGNFQREGIPNRAYLPFTFEGEIIDPEQYLAWCKLKEEYELRQYLEEFEEKLIELL